MSSTLLEPYRARVRRRGQDQRQRRHEEGRGGRAAARGRAFPVCRGVETALDTREEATNAARLVRLNRVRCPTVRPEHEIAPRADQLLTFGRREPATVEASNEPSLPSTFAPVGANPAPREADLQCKYVLDCRIKSSRDQWTDGSQGQTVESGLRRCERRWCARPPNVQRRQHQRAQRSQSVPPDAPRVGRRPSSRLMRGEQRRPLWPGMSTVAPPSRIPRWLRAGEPHRDRAYPIAQRA
jgi:hypothetical protein